MALTLRLLRRDPRTSHRRRSRAFRPGLHPVVEGLEARTVLSTGGVAAPAVMAAAKPHQATTVNVLPQLMNAVSLVGTTFNLATSLGGQTVNQALALSSSPNANDPTCPILNLHLAPIHLNLLGLNVDTSNICLDVTAHEGGGLLGDLLCGLSNALSTNTLGTFLGGLSSSNLGTLLNGLTGLVNGALGNITTTAPPGSIAGASTPTVGDTTPGACDILNLSLGPIDLNLLGLEVHLDNCNNGPATVSITAVPSEGLLGQLLCDLDNLLSSNASVRAINVTLNQIAREIAALV